MDLALGRQRFDTSRRALVVGLVRSLADADRLVGEGAEALAVVDAVDPAAVRDRVGVPVTTVSAGSIEVDGGGRHAAAGPFDDLPEGERLGAFAAAALDGASVLVTSEVRAVRRIAEVAARIRAAGARR